jgi:regulation of enolase protein 1 (concanavalin A-like superfamily)
LDHRAFGYDFTGYQTYQCVDGAELRKTGVIYGIGVNPKDNLEAVLKTTVTPAPLPCGWDNKDIAASPSGFAGTAGYSGGQFVVTDYGSQIDNSNDSFHYVYEKMTGDGTITARVTTTTPSAHSRAGVMMRETLAFNSKHAMVTLSPLDKGAIFGYRNTTGGYTVNANQPGIPVPYWVRLVRAKDTFTGYISPDEKNWTQTGKVSIPMSDTIYVGLASSSYNYYTMQTAKFDDVDAPVVADNPGCSSPSPSPPSCIEANPQVIMTPLLIQSTAGASVNFQVQVNNVNSSTCKIALYNLRSTLPAGFTGSYNPSSIWLDSGKSASVTFQVTSTSSVAIGNYPITVNAVRSGNSSVFGTATSSLNIKEPLPQ